MLRKVGLLIVLCGMWVGPAMTQDAVDPSPLPPNLQPITADNVGGVQLIGGLGKGLLIDLHVRESGDVVVVTTRGAAIYPGGDLNADPQFLPYDPNPFDARLARFASPSDSVLDGDRLFVDALVLDLATGETTINTQPLPTPTGPADTSITLSQEDINTRLITVTLADGRQFDNTFCVESATDFNTIGWAQSPDAMTFYLYSSVQGGIQAFDLTTDPPTLLAHHGDYRLVPADIAFSPDGRLLYAAMQYERDPCGDYADSGVHVFDMTTLERVDIWPAQPPFYVAGEVATLPDGTVAIADFRRIFFWRDGELINTITDDEDAWRFVRDLTASDTENYVAGYVANDTLIIWDSNGTQIAQYVDLDNSFWGDDIAFVGDVLIYNGGAGAVVLRTLPDGKVMQTINVDDAINHIAAALIDGELVVFVAHGPETADDSENRVVNARIYTLPADALSAEPQLRNSLIGMPTLPVMTTTTTADLIIFTDNGRLLTDEGTFTDGLVPPAIETATGLISGFVPGLSLVTFSPDERLLFTHWGGATIAIYGVPGE